MIDPLYYDLDNYSLHFIDKDEYIKYSDAYASDESARQCFNYKADAITTMYERGLFDNFYALRCKDEVVRVWIVTEDEKSDLIRVSRVLTVQTPKPSFIPGLSGYLVWYMLSRFYSEYKGIWYTGNVNDVTIATYATDQVRLQRSLTHYHKHAHTSLYRMCENALRANHFDRKEGTYMVRGVEQVIGYSFFGTPVKCYITTDDNGEKIYTN